MHLSLLISFGSGTVFSNTGLLIAIAVLACVLGAEIACISILISKMWRARRRRYEEENEEESSYRNYGVGAVLLLGAVPQSTFFALTVLAILTAVFAVVFLVLLLIFRAYGYDFAASDRYREEKARRKAENEREAQTVPEMREDHATVTAFEETVPLDESDGQGQEEYTASKTAETEEESPVLFGEEEDDSSREPADGTAQDESEEPVTEEPVTEEPVTEEPVSDTGMTPVTPATTTYTASVTSVEGGPASADGSRPYKVVEKIVTETYEETYEETHPTPAPAPDPQSNSSNKEVLEKLTDILVELQKQKDGEGKEEPEDESKKTKSDAVATFASDASLEDEDADEDEDDDEDDADEIEEDGKREDDEDRDDEENDTEGDHFTGNERIIGFDETTGCYIVAHYRKSFEAKLIQSRPHIKKYYSELKNALLSYKGTKDRFSWSADSFHNGRTPIAKINVKTRILELYLALDPASLEGTVYRGKDVGSKKKYADTPFQYKLRTPRKFKWALELVQRVCEEHGLSPIDIEHVDYEQQYPFDTTENLVARNLIKEYIREEKPATTFELAPDHVPSVPEEDDSVIPANANFSWEFDNEMLVEKEPDPIPEPEPESEPEPEPEPDETPTPEPTPEQPPQPSSVTRKTVKITEMRYTERYYADGQPTYEQVVATKEPIEATAVSSEDIENTDNTENNQTVESTETVDRVEDTETESSAEETVAASADSEEEPTSEVDVWADLSEPEEQENSEEEAETAEEELEEEPEEEMTEVQDTETDGEEEDDLLFDGDPEEDTVEEDTVEENTAEEASAEEPLPFRPSFYANRNYYAERENEDNGVSDATAEIQDTPEAVEAKEEPMISEPARRRIVNPGIAVVDICSVEEHFPAGAVICLDTLKAKELVLPSAHTLKIYASGTLSKSFTVEANHFTLDAISAISDAEGDVVMVR